MSRTLAIGLDGCSWNVLEPLLDTGRLPHLARLRDDGAHGVLESTIPFYTGPSWASYATGSSPAAHGVYDFTMLRPDGTLAAARRADLRRPTYYQQLGRERRRTVLVNLPIDQDGCEGAVIVNSWLTAADARRMLPFGRRERYARLLEAYRVFPDDPGDVEELCALERARFDLARELFLAEEWDHFFVLFSSTDWLGHTLTGRFLAGDETAREAMLRLYGQLDEHVGWLVEHAPDATVAVLSDHGQTRETAVLRVNAVLRDLGELAVAADDGRESPYFADRRPRRKLKLPLAVSALRRNPLARPLGLAARRALASGGVHLVAPLPRVDYARSRAVVPTDASLAVHAGGAGGLELERVRAALLGLRLADGRPAVDGVWTPEELFGHATAGAGPALLFAPAQGVRSSAALEGPAVVESEPPGRGCHQRDGIVLLGGTGVVRGRLDASICDVAPTLLWATDAAVPAGVDGRVLFEAFDPELVQARPVREAEAAVDAPGGADGESAHQEVTRRLKALGYI